MAFNQNGIILKHAFDVAVVLDTMAHDPRLDLKQTLQVRKCTLNPTVLMSS